LEALVDLLCSISKTIPGLAPLHIKKATKKMVDLLANVGQDNELDFCWDNLPNLSLKKSCLFVFDIDHRSRDGVSENYHEIGGDLLKATLIPLP
jgi:hypothetical protein